MPFLSTTSDDQRQMLATIGVDSVESLFDDVKPQLRLQSPLAIPPGISEIELMAEMQQMAARNVDSTRQLSFLGAGCYDHYVPAVCEAITSRSEFATAYTPYQPELSQGTLQAIFEFQSAICELTGLDVANASLYDGATAAAEAMYLSQQVVGGSEVVVLGSVSPLVRRVLDTYADGYGLKITVVPVDAGSGTTAVDAARSACRERSGDLACLVVQQPNFLGQLEDLPGLCETAHEAGAACIVSCDPLSLGVLEAPGSCGADIAVGDGQPLGNAQAFGGPSFGFLAAHERFVRRMPGRIVGRSVDRDGKDAFVLTLQTREQHIRREKATSNICTNQALNALSGIVYLCWLGPAGLQQLSELLVDRAQAVRESLQSLPGVSCPLPPPSFREVVVDVGRPARQVVDACRARGVHPGYVLADDYPELGEGALLVAATERRTDPDIARLAHVLGEVLA